MLEISTAKVAHVILKSNEYDAKVGAWDNDRESGNGAEEPESILEDFAEDATRSEVAQFIAALNDDEQADLVALAWIGRGTYSSDQFQEAVETAKAERVNATEVYLLGIPLLGAYLAEGLEKMGLSATEAEFDLLGYEELEIAPET
jgi:hypothetical protein